MILNKAKFQYHYHQQKVKDMTLVLFVIKGAYSYE